ncbi:MAG: hypothetical protein ACTSYB_01500 [Candidatus Helarchaeota archaeon]
MLPRSYDRTEVQLSCLPAGSRTAVPTRTYTSLIRHEPQCKSKPI